MPALERFYYKGLLKNSSGTKFFACLREVFALGRFHCNIKYNDGNIKSSNENDMTYT